MVTTDDAEYSKTLEKALTAGRASVSAANASMAGIATATPAVRRRNHHKNIGKVVAGRKLANHSGASAWRTACSDLGYLRKGSAFKRIPEKGSAAYNQIKALSKAYENK